MRTSLSAVDTTLLSILFCTVDPQESVLLGVLIGASLKRSSLASVFTMLFGRSCPLSNHDYAVQCHDKCLSEKQQSGMSVCNAAAKH